EWLATPLERDGLHKQAAWRGDPKVTGKSLCVGDIGTHVENMVRTLTGLRIARLCARLDTLVPGRTLDDNASILVDFEGGARGLYWASQVRSEEHTSELQSPYDLVCRLLLEKKKKKKR